MRKKAKRIKAVLKRKPRKEKSAMKKPKFFGSSEPSEPSELPGKPEEVKEAVKPDDQCTVEGCAEKKAPGQTYVCSKHIRT